MVRRQPRQPRLHSVERLSVCQLLPLIPTPRFGLDQCLSPRTHVVGRHQLAAGEDLHRVDVGVGTLVTHRERGETLDLVSPQVDTNRPVSRRRVHVDDGTPDGDLATVLHLVLAAVARVDEPFHQVGLIDDPAGPDDDRLDVLYVRSETLHERPGRSDENFRGALRITKMPHGSHAATHRFHRRAHAFERQRLPRREDINVVGAEKAREIGGEPLGISAGRHSDHNR